MDLTGYVELIMMIVVCAGCAAADDGEGIKVDSFLSDM